MVEDRERAVGVGASAQLSVRNLIGWSFEIETYPEKTSKWGERRGRASQGKLQLAWAIENVLITAAILLQWLQLFTLGVVVVVVVNDGDQSMKILVPRYIVRHNGM